MGDRLIRATAANGSIRAVGAITTRLTDEARERHKLSAVATAALGRTMTAGLLLASNMKRTEARVNLRFRGDGPLSGVMVDAGCDGTVRGYVGNPSVELPPNAQGKLDVGGAIGQGYLYAVRDVGYGYPYSSTTEIVSGEVAEDITHYLANSEQTPSALSLGVFVQSQGVTAAGGLLIQIMPQASVDDSVLAALESRITALQGFTPLLRSGKSLPEIFNDLLGDMGLEIFPEVQLLRFHCGCTNARMLQALKLLGQAELRDMIEKDGGAEATCHFCNSVYHTDVSGLEQLILEMQQSEAAGS
ncbi:MAG TPA: Hsp33 family molecular chaperone HslO [Coleofasciculaceae cyanobacterium]